MSEAPSKILRALSEFTESLQQSLGDQLTALILFGDLARPGEFDAKTSSIEVLVVLRDITSEALQTLEEPVQRAGRRYRLETLLLTEQELHGASDVFPIRFLEMQQHHKLLAGKDVLGTLDIDESHLRLRCEQEIRNLLLRLRNLYVHRSRQRKRLAETMRISISPLIRTLSACVGLKTGVSPMDPEDVIVAVTDEFDVQAGSLRDVLALTHASRLPPHEELQDAYLRLLEFLGRIAHAVDQMEVND